MSSGRRVFKLIEIWFEKNPAVAKFLEEAINAYVKVTVKKTPGGNKTYETAMDSIGRVIKLEITKSLPPKKTVSYTSRMEFNNKMKDVVYEEVSQAGFPSKIDIYDIPEQPYRFVRVNEGSNTVNYYTRKDNKIITIPDIPEKELLRRPFIDKANRAFFSILVPKGNLTI